jgi:DNA-binding NarL/FixJ family response regulator
VKGNRIGQEAWPNPVIDMSEVKVTARDRQVLNLLVEGCSNKEIAGQLHISPRTVKQHLRTLFLRAGIRDGRKRVKLAIAMFDQREAK